MYRNILKDLILPKEEVPLIWILQQNNDSKPKSKVVKEYYTLTYN